MKPGWRLRRLDTGNRLVAHRIWRSIVPVDDRGEIRLIATCVRCAAAAWAGNWALNTLHNHPAYTAVVAGLWGVAAWRAEPLPRPASATIERAATCNDSGPEEDPSSAGEGMWIMELDPDNPARTHITWTKDTT